MADAMKYRALFAPDALLPEGWARNVLITWDGTGKMVQVTPGAQAPAGVLRAAGPVIPGLPNLHSHAFQRAFAGLSEHRGQQQDSFWSWRTLMYRFALEITPEMMEAVAFWLYIEMLEAGYTSVCEFHYIHHDQDGRPYADSAELAWRLMRAAQQAGIGMTLLPVLYQTGNFGGAAPEIAQRRFIHSTESMLRLLHRLRPACDAAGIRLGLAPHSLRAVTPESLRDILSGMDELDPEAPVHIHVAEQAREVDDCLAWSGQRPVEWLLDHADVDRRWCLVHATHMTEQEIRRAAKSGAVAGLCPTTEANLGDGIFDMPAWLGSGGHWGIGSDSHVCVSAAEELAMLEYGQRLQRRQRNVLTTEEQPQAAACMLLQAVSGGARASGRAIGGLAAGMQADFVVLDAHHIALDGLPAPAMLSAHVFASHRTSALAEVWVAGRRQVAGGRHRLHDIARPAFIAARSKLITQAGV